MASFRGRTPPANSRFSRLGRVAGDQRGMGRAQRHWGSGRRIGVTRSAGCSGFNFDQILSTAVPSAKHCRLLAGYPLNMERGAATARDMIVVDVRHLRDPGTKQQAADSCVVLGRFRSDCPENGLANGPCEAMRIGFAGQGAIGIAEESRSIASRAQNARRRAPFPPPVSLTKIGQRLSINDANGNVQSSSMRHSSEQQRRCIR